MPPRVSQAEYRALAELRYHIRRFLGASERAARESGLEPRQHQLLLAIKGLPERTLPTIGEIARRLHVEHHSAVEMIDRLERRRLVTRSRDDRDRRRVLIELTSQGESLLLALSSSHRHELRAEAPALLRTLVAVVATKRPRRSSSPANGRRARAADAPRKRRRNA